MSSSTSGQSGIGFCGLLTIVFIVLKLTDKIDWSWIWVLSPLWLPIALAIIILFIFVVIMAMFK